MRPWGPPLNPASRMWPRGLNKYDTVYYFHLGRSWAGPWIINRAHTSSECDVSPVPVRL